MTRNGILFLKTQSPGIEAMAATSAQSFDRMFHLDVGLILALDEAMPHRDLYVGFSKRF